MHVPTYQYNYAISFVKRVFRIHLILFIESENKFNVGRIKSIVHVYTSALLTVTASD